MSASEQAQSPSFPSVVPSVVSRTLGSRDALGPHETLGSHDAGSATSLADAMPPITSGVLRVQHSAVAVATARRQFRHDVESIISLGEPVLDDLEVVISELLGNSVRHAAPIAGNVVLLAWRIVGDDIVVRVTDGGGGRGVAPRQVGPLSDSGRGLQIVERLARVWGVSEHAGGLRSVWAALSVSEPSRALRLVT